MKRYFGKNSLAVWSLVEINFWQVGQNTEWKKYLFQMFYTVKYSIQLKILCLVSKRQIEKIENICHKEIKKKPK